jgi:hypothetical protein
MTELTSVQELFNGRHFDKEFIVLCLRWYLTLKRSLGNLYLMNLCYMTLAHRLLNSKAQVVKGNLYAIPEETGLVDKASPLTQIHEKGAFQRQWTRSSVGH